MAVLTFVWRGLQDALLEAWELWWPLVLGFALSAIVQSWVSRERIASSLGSSGPRPIALATGLGAASSSCSYAAIAIAKSLFQKGASTASALAFQFASTNLVWELGLILWVLIGWQFVAAEYVGGIVMIVLMAITVRLCVSPRLEEQARRHALESAGHDHDHQGGAGSPPPAGWRERLTSRTAWADVGANFRGDWGAIYKEIAIGFLLAGFIAQLGNGIFDVLFLKGAPPAVAAIENVIIGPLIAVLSFVCSIGNVPLAAVLWSRGISFAGVTAFIFADLIVLPILVIYRKYYGTRFAQRITALQFAAMVAAGLIVSGIFSALGILPSGPRPGRADIFGSVRLDYTLVFNIIAFAAFTALFWISRPSRPAGSRVGAGPVAADLAQ